MSKEKTQNYFFSQNKSSLLIQISVYPFPLLHWHLPASNRTTQQPQTNKPNGVGLKPKGFQIFKHKCPIMHKIERRNRNRSRESYFYQKKRKASDVWCGKWTKEYVIREEEERKLTQRRLKKGREVQNDVELEEQQREVWRRCVSEFPNCLSSFGLLYEASTALSQLSTAPPTPNFFFH